MRIGLSLPLQYVLGLDAPSDSACFTRFLGEPDAALPELRKIGVDSIELQGVGPGSFDLPLLTAMRRIANAGMEVTFHSYLPPATQCDAPSIAATPPLPESIRFLQSRDARPIMVVHAHADSHATPNALARSSIQGLEALIGGFHRHDIPIRVALEINRYHGVDGPGVTYGGLLDIVEPFADDDVGLCWDMGHTQSSVLQERLPPVPPPEFVARVIHSHVHDLSADGDTHWPLAEDCSHLRSGIDLLEAKGYTGIFNLELYPRRWPTTYVVKDEINRSVVRLRRMRG